MIVLTKTVKVGRDHLIHRKRSPFPYEGKALTRLKVGMTYNVRHRGNAPRRGAGLQVTSSTAERSPFPEKTEWRVKSGEWS